MLGYIRDMLIAIYYIRLHNALIQQRQHHRPSSLKMATFRPLYLSPALLRVSTTCFRRVRPQRRFLNHHSSPNRPENRIRALNGLVAFAVFTIVGAGAFSLRRALSTPYAENIDRQESQGPEHEVLEDKPLENNFLEDQFLRQSDLALQLWEAFSEAAELRMIHASKESLRP